MSKKDYKDLENQGWEAMFDTLEQEMPVKKKRRGLLWLFFFLGLATIASGYWYAKTQNDIQPIQTIDSKPIVESNFTKNNDFSSKTGNNTEGGHEAKFEKRQKQPTFKLYSNLKVNKNDAQDDLIYSNNIEKTKNHISLNINEPLKQDSSISQNRNETSLVSIKDNQINILTENRNKPKFETLQKPIEFDEISILKTVPLSIAQDTNLKIESQPIILPAKIEKSKNNRLHLGITAGIHTENGQKLDGFQVGLVLNKPLNKDWSLGTGLSFLQTHTLGDSITYYQASNISFSSASSSLQSSNPIILDKLYYLELPLTIQYQRNKHFSFSTGIKTSYLIDESVRTNGSSVFWVKSSTNTSVSLDLLSSVNAQTLGLNRLDMSWIGAITYLPTKHIGFSLRYNLGLRNIINRNNWSAYNRYLGLNVTYMF